MIQNVYPYKWLTYYVALVGLYGSNDIHGLNVSNVKSLIGLSGLNGSYEL